MLCSLFRITTLTDNLATAPIERNWNRLMRLQGVFANIGINFLNVSDYKLTYGHWSGLGIEVK